MEEEQEDNLALQQIRKDLQDNFEVEIEETGPLLSQLKDLSSRIISIT